MQKTVEGAWFYFIVTKREFTLHNWFIFCFTRQVFLCIYHICNQGLATVSSKLSVYPRALPRRFFWSLPLCQGSEKRWQEHSVLYDFDSSFCTTERETNRKKKKITATAQLKLCLTVVWFSCCFRWNMEPTEIALPTTKCPWAIS